MHDKILNYFRLQRSQLKWSIAQKGTSIFPYLKSCSACITYIQHSENISKTKAKHWQLRVFTQPPQQSSRDFEHGHSHADKQSHFCLFVHCTVLQVALGSMSAISVGLVLLTAHTAPTNAWSGFTRFSKAKGGTHTGEAPPREKRDDNTPAKQKPWSKWFSAKAAADETPKTDPKAATTHSDNKHMAVCANGVFVPVSFLSRKQTTPKTPEPPIAAPKGVLRRALDHAKTFNTWVYNQ
eukprot:17455-Heterococcus_DN1.PRE.1